MKREIESSLIEWKNNPRRRPLLLRGARQVGKSYTIRDFGKKHFKKYIEINFEYSPEFEKCFTTVHPEEINTRISFIANEEISDGDTLLFFDEVQKCPQAIKALRYYYEKMPNLHVIAAGSLLEFTLESEELEIPVGRIQYLYMHPFSFSEFCLALEENQAYQLLHNESMPYMADGIIHNKILELLKLYYIIGGMPAVIDEYVHTKSIQQCQRIQLSIIQTFQDDFGKYARLSQHKHLIKVFNAVPKMIGHKFKYVNIDRDTQTRELKNALELLERAGIIYRIRATGGDSLPLAAGAKENQFKVLFLDVGLMQNMCGLSADIFNADNILNVHRGSVAEQFVGQECIATTDPYQKPELFYWIREAKSSNAEVDYLLTLGSHIIPVEVKSGPKGKLRSLIQFVKQYQSNHALVLSQKIFDINDEVQFAPLYSIRWFRLFGKEYFNAQKDTI